MRQILPHPLTGSLDLIHQEYRDEWDDAFKLLQFREISPIVLSEDVLLGILFWGNTNAVVTLIGCFAESWPITIWLLYTNILKAGAE